MSSIRNLILVAALTLAYGASLPRALGVTERQSGGTVAESFVKTGRLASDDLENSHSLSNVARKIGVDVFAKALSTPRAALKMAQSAAFAARQDLAFDQKKDPFILSSLVTDRQAGGSGLYRECIRTEDDFDRATLKCLSSCDFDKNANFTGENCPENCCVYIPKDITRESFLSQRIVCLVDGCCIRYGLQRGFTSGIAKSTFYSNEPLVATTKLAGGVCAVKSEATGCKSCAIAGTSEPRGKNIKFDSCPNGFSLPKYSEEFAGITNCSA